MGVHSEHSAMPFRICVVLLLFENALRALASTGQSGCPCIDGTSKLAKFKTGSCGSKGFLEYKPSGAATSFCYDPKWGSSSCIAHDQKKWSTTGTPQPFCFKDAAGTKVKSPPSWCADKWCWVDKHNCNLPAMRSTFFPDSGLYYS